jgi:photosystem II stability/assembly factor-like uncharacterized protein
MKSTTLTLTALGWTAALRLASHASGQTIDEFPPSLLWVGTQAFQGRAVAVSVNPDDPNEAIVASESGGLFKTTNHGTNWTHLDNLPMFRMRDVKYGPLIPGSGRLVMASGWADSHTDNRGGIWRSTDGGTTWSKPASSNPGCSSYAGTWAIALQPGADSVFVGTDCGLAISRDYGATWTHTVPPGAGLIKGVVCPTSGVVDICGDNGHQRSTNNGVSFNSPTGSPVGNQPHCLAFSPVEPSVLFVAGGSLGFGPCPLDQPLAPGTLYEGDPNSSGPGMTWAPVHPLVCMGIGRPSWVATQLSRDGNPDHFDIYFGRGADTFRQTVTGKGTSGPRCDRTAWTPVSVDHSDHNGMDFNPLNHRGEFLVSDGGIERPTDESDPINAGATWALLGPAGNGYHALSVYEVGGQIYRTFFGGHVDLYIGTQDNRFWASSDAGGTWPYGTGTEGFHIQLPRYVSSHSGQYVEFADMANGNRKALPHFLGTPDLPWANIPGLVVNNPTLVGNWAYGPEIYAQFQQFCKKCYMLMGISTNAGTTWNVPFFLPLFPASFVQPSVPSFGSGPPDITLYCAYTRSDGSGIGLWRITGIHGDGTVTAPKVTYADFGLGNIGQFAAGEAQFLVPTVWAVDPNDPSHLLAADVQAHQIKSSRTGGASWVPDSTLTDLVTGYSPGTGEEFRFDIAAGEYVRGLAAPGCALQTHVFAFDPYHRDHILVGTEAAGIMRSTNGGTTWYAIPGSRKITGITSVFFVDEFTHANPYSEAIVGTYGRGLWKLTFTPPGPSGTYYRLGSDVRAAWRDGCWLRHAGCLSPDDLSAPGACDSCHYEVVVGGQITDLRLDQNGQVVAILIDSGRLVASSQDGQPVVPRVPALYSQQLGQFAGCADCLSLLQQGGSIKGVVLENLQLRAIIGGFGQLPGEGEIDQFSPVTPTPTQIPDVTPPNGPYLFVLGSIPSGGIATARRGDSVIVAGTNFCRQGCLPLTVTVGSRDLGTNIIVSPDGSFQVGFSVTDPNGLYVVTALQQTGAGQLLSAASQLLVAGADVEPPPVLEIRNQGGLLMLSWPADAQGYFIEWTADLVDPNSWQTYPSQPTLSGDEYVAFVQATGTPAFFRLRTQLR